MRVFSSPPSRRSRVLTWLGYAAIVAIFAAFSTALAVYLLSEHRLQRAYDVHTDLAPPSVTLIEEGRHLAHSRGCADCHGEDFGGKVVIDQMPFARLIGDNLTKMPAEHQDKTVHERMHRALHHGVNLDSRPLMMMPSKEFSSLSAREIEALSAYFASLQQVDRTLPESTLGPLGRILLVAGKLDGFLSAEVIDHSAVAIAEPPELGTIDYGRHAAQLCAGCHQADFAGGPMSHGPADAPPAANLTRHVTGLAKWSERDFIAAMRSGKRPDGSAIDGNAMPWRTVGQASDLELKSIWLFLRDLPPRDRDVRKNVLR